MGGLFTGSNNGSTIDARAMFDSLLGESIADIVQMGALVSIGTTRDRGALSVTVTVDGQWEREYFRHSDDLGEWLKAVEAALRARGLGQPTQQPTMTPRATRGRSKLA